MHLDSCKAIHHVQPSDFDFHFMILPLKRSVERPFSYRNGSRKSGKRSATCDQTVDKADLERATSDALRVDAGSFDSGPLSLALPMESNA